MSKKVNFSERLNRVLSTVDYKWFSGHYNPCHVLQKNCSYTQIISERNNGKSVSMEIMILYAFVKYGYPSCWMRRNATTLQDSDFKLTMFKTAFKIVPNLKKYTGVTMRQGAFCGYWKDDHGKVKYDEPFCYTYALSQKETKKGTMDIDDVLFIVFDEYLARGNYLKNEYMEFCNALSTIFRECFYAHIVMLGNPVSWSSPYFTEFGIKHPRDIPQGKILTYKFLKNTTLAIERCGMLSSRNENNDLIADRFFAFKDSKVESITMGKWEVPMYPHIYERTKDKKLDAHIYLLYDNDIIKLELINLEKALIVNARYYPLEIPTEKADCILALRNQSCVADRKYNYYPSDKLAKLVLQLYKENRWYYSNNEVGEICRLFFLQYGKI